jgi:hypothetical protein
MKKRIFSDYGIEVFQKENKFLIRFDAGEIVSRYVEIEVTKKDAELAQTSPKYAYDVIIKNQNKNMFGID